MFTSDLVWGIDIGDSCIKVVHVKREGRQLYVLDADYLELDVDLKAKDGGQVVLQQALDGLFSRLPIEKKAEVCISISARDVNNRYITLPAELKAKALELSIREEAERQIPFPLDEVEWGHYRLPDRDDQAQVAIFSVKRDKIENLLNMINLKRVKVRGVQVPGLALYNYLTRIADIDEHVVVLDFGEKSTDLLVVHDGGCWLRSMPLSGQHITELLEKKFRITTKEANVLKHEMERSPQRDKLFRVIEPKLKELVTEIKRSLNFRRTQVKTLKPTKFVAYGGSSQLAGVAEYFSKQLGLAELDLKPTGVLDFSRMSNPERVQNNIASFAVSLGLAFQALGEAKVELNLMPRRQILMQLLRDKRPLALAANLAFVVMVLILYFSGDSVTAKLQTVDNIVGQKTQQVQAVISEYQSKVSLLTPRLAEAEFVIKLLKGGDYSAKIYDVVAEILEQCEGVYLTEIKVNPIKPEEYTDEVPAVADETKPVRQPQRHKDPMDVDKILGVRKPITGITVSLAFAGESAQANEVFHGKLVAHPLFGDNIPTTDQEEKGWSINLKLGIDDVFSINGQVREDVQQLRKNLGWVFQNEKKATRVYNVNAQTLVLPVNIGWLLGEAKESAP